MVHLNSLNTYRKYTYIYLYVYILTFYILPTIGGGMCLIQAASPLLLFYAQGLASCFKASKFNAFD